MESRTHTADDNNTHDNKKVFLATSFAMDNLN